MPSIVQGRTGICFGCGASLTVPILSSAEETLNLNFSSGSHISDRYIIRERVGEGGMGVVYRAEDTLVNEEVALKFMKPRLLRSQRGQMGFIQEAQIARRLRHENIVAVHDLSWTCNGILYLTMEFLKGSSLRALLRKRRRCLDMLDVRAAVSFMKQALTALEYAHRFVIHRDLKPENIFVLPGERIKVLDFGLARALNEETESNPAAAAARVVGTRAYAAPEQKRRKQIDQRADLYAMGLVFYELLTLRTPLDNQVRVEEARSDVAPSLITVLDHALAPAKEDRWQSAAEFRRELTAAYEQSYRAPKMKATAISGKKVSTKDMAYQEGGSFLMGNKEVPEEAPEFETYVKPFYIDKFPVTVRQYEEFLKETGRRPPKFWEDNRYHGPAQPVIGVSWEDANAYAEWAGKQLPTETQWEFAARGKENRKYPWGNAEPDTNRCNFGDYLGMPSIVNMHKEGATPESVLDMAGNVYEWTSDSFVSYSQDAAAADIAPLRVVRGGCWYSKENELRCTHRKGLFPEAQLTTTGFRCVLPAEE